jgi:hypothetical protein
MRFLFTLLTALVLSLPAVAHAWWNADWTARKKVVLDTEGLALATPVTNVPVLVRLHTGNFPFSEADLDGKDLRFVAEDDTTPLEFHIEAFDGTNELALVWVKLPQATATKGSAGLQPEGRLRRHAHHRPALRREERGVPGLECVREADHGRRCNRWRYRRRRRFGGL